VIGAREQLRARLGVAGVAVVTVLATLLLATGAGQAVTADNQASVARAPVNTTVLSNEFGKAKSRIVGTFGTAGTVVGSFTPRRFAAVGDQLFAIGTLRADLVRGNGNVVGSVAERVRLPVSSAQGVPLSTARQECDILRLVLGPLDLDLLGLQVHLDRVVLNIIAVAGAGNLLGNLLCAIAGLLDGTGLLTQISQILNAILAILRL
jgi:hypothetical protein